MDILGLRVSTVRASIICIMVLAVTLLSQAPATDAELASTTINIGIPYVVGPGFTYAMPFGVSAFAFMQAFNSSTLASDFTGSLAISFSPSGISGPGGPAALPAMAETTDENVVLTRSYFWNDFISGG